MSLTQAIDVVAAFIAMASCGYVGWLRQRSDRSRRLALTLLLVEAGLLVDAIFNLRWRFHDLLANKANALHVYGQRTAPQIIVLALIAGVVGVAAAIGLWHLRQRPGAAMAVAGVILSLGCWAFEVISLHAVDALLYRPIHGVMRVAMIWVLAALMTSFGILSDMKEQAS